MTKNSSPGVSRRVGRPSVADQRVEQILDAFTRCVARYGMAGTTLQHVADEAGLARGNVRHYVGNRDELRKLFGRRLVERYSNGAQNIATTASRGKQAETLARYFFRDRVPTDDDAAINALFAAARFSEVLRKHLHSVYSDMELLIANALIADFPGRAPGTYEDAAYQIISLAYGHWTFAEIGFPREKAGSALRGALVIIARVAKTKGESSSK